MFERRVMTRLGVNIKGVASSAVGGQGQLLREPWTVADWNCKKRRFSV
jgi:hypothetical protein